jgi:DNA-binding winged helix-turn-helix (wHTH) protein
VEEIANSTRVIRFGVFEVDLRAGELRKNGLKIKLQEQPFQVLAMLLRRPGDVVTREELQRAVWPADTFVDFDRGLNKAINKIREALGDEADNPRFVETLPRRGYRFIYPLDTRAVGEPSPGPADAGPPSPRGRGAGGEGVAGDPASASEGHPRFDFAHRPEPVEGQGVPLQPAPSGAGAVREQPPRGRWALASAAIGIGAIAVLAYVLTRPLPPPRVLRYVQITSDAQGKGLVSLVQLAGHGWIEGLFRGRRPRPGVRWGR